MKKIFYLIVLFSILKLNAQDKMTTKSGQILFEASVPSFVEIKATSKRANCVLNLANGDLFSVVQIKSFQFKYSLMEKHFNENYIESNKYPKSFLKGTLHNFKESMLNENYQTFILDGKFDLHGKSVAIKIPINIRKTNNLIEIEADFKLNPLDFDIKIPDAVSKKVAKEVEVKVNYTLN